MKTMTAQPLALADRSARRALAPSCVLVPWTIGAMPSNHGLVGHDRTWSSMTHAFAIHTATAFKAYGTRRPEDTST